ncbi:MAG: PQQ-binding-like beta-propeller repeat protein [Bryobacterales bacterium]
MQNSVFRTTLVASVVLLNALSASAADWPMFGADPQRTGWAREEKAISPQNASSMKLLWKTTVKNETKALAALTAPIVMTGIETEKGVKDLVYIGGTDNVFYAIDASTGSIVWQKEFKSLVKPVRDSFWLCPNGLNATPAADRRRGVVYVISNDGRLYALDLATGEERYRALQVVPPYAKAWSLNLWEDKIYTSISQNCGETPSGVISIDVSTPGSFTIQHFRTAKFAAGVWGRGGAIFGNDGLVYAATGDGEWDPSIGNYGESILALNPDTLALVDYFTPENWQKVKDRDFDIGTSPVAFTYEGKELIAVGGKEGLVYLVRGRQGARMGGETHHQALYTSPLLSNEDEWFEGRGVWGGLSYRLDPDGRHWVYVPLWGLLVDPKLPHHQRP